MGLAEGIISVCHLCFIHEAAIVVRQSGMRHVGEVLIHPLLLLILLNKLILPVFLFLLLDYHDFLQCFDVLSFLVLGILDGDEGDLALLGLAHVYDALLGEHGAQALGKSLFEQ